MKKFFMCWLLVLGYCLSAYSQEVSNKELFGELKLVLEVDCSKPNDDLEFTDYPKGISKVETILGQQVRTMPNKGDEGKYFAYKVGKGNLFKAGKPYVLEIEFPEDQPRSFTVINRGNETLHGVATGAATADTLIARASPTNPESIDYPLSGKFRKWRHFFFMHQRFKDLNTPRKSKTNPLTLADGIWIIFGQYKYIISPLSKGAAISKFRIYEVMDLEKTKLTINYPPENLPRRNIFWREEMSDRVISRGEWGLDNDIDWFEYKVQLMQFLGINTFSKDLLEFGHNQGWDSADYGGKAWVNKPKWKKRWEKILDMLKKYQVSVLPYYEYYGSIGSNSLGIQKRAKPLGGKDNYTAVPWSEKANADLTDPDTLEDAKKILEATIVRFKDKAKFLGAWFRSRPSANPIGFGEKTRKRFAEEVNNNKIPTTRELKKDKELLKRYYAWWFVKRKQFLESLGSWLSKEIDRKAIILYTTDTQEAGVDIGRYVVTDNIPLWEKTLTEVKKAAETATFNKEKKRKAFSKMKPIAFDEVVSNDLHLQAMQKPHWTYGKWEWQHACPQADPDNYKDAENSLLTFTFNRLYTVSSPKAFDAFRNKQGLAVIRHYQLNENEMMDADQENEIVGYFVCDFERNGPYSMLAEARAMAFGNPNYLGYLASNNFTRVFPEYARRFNQAFLSLPALPGKILPEASSDQEVIVRAIPTPENGTYLAVVNSGLTNKLNIKVNLPKTGKVTDTAVNKPLTADKSITLNLYPGELRAFNIK